MAWKAIYEWSRSAEKQSNAMPDFDEFWRAGHSGPAFISLASEFPELAKEPFLTWVAKDPINEKMADLITQTVKALQLASIAKAGRSNHWLARNEDQTDNLIPKRLS